MPQCYRRTVAAAADTTRFNVDYACDVRELERSTNKSASKTTEESFGGERYRALSHSVALRATVSSAGRLPFATHLCRVRSKAEPKNDPSSRLVIELDRRQDHGLAKDA